MGLQNVLGRVTPELFITGVWLVLFGFTFGLVVFFLIRHVLFPEEAYAPKKLLPSYQEDVRRTIGVLQQWQVMIGRSATERDPGLVDLGRLLRRMQRDFGRNASLEDIIQALVARDLEQQVANRKHRKWEVSQPEEAMAPVQQEVAVA